MTSPNQTAYGPIYPSHLKLFSECRRRFLYKIVERRRVEEPPSVALAKGNAVHSILKASLKSLMLPNPRLPLDLEGLVRGRLPLELYRSESIRQADVAEVTAWLKSAYSYLGPSDEVLGVEQFLRRRYPGDEFCEPFEAAALVDLVLLRGAPDGEPYVELIDWKTGRSGWEDPLAPVMARFVAKPLIARGLPGARNPRVVFTWNYLAEQDRVSLELDLGTCAERWEEVKRSVSEIHSEERWEPSPSPLCGFCPFNGNGCDAAMTQPDDGQLW